MYKISLPSSIQVSSTAFLLWCWQMDFNYFKLYTPMLSSRTGKMISFPWHQMKESGFMWPGHLQPSEPSLWMRTSGIYLMTDLNWMSPAHPSSCHMAKDAFSWWTQADQGPGLCMRVGSTNKKHMVAIWEWQGRQEHREAAATLIRMRRQKSCDLLAHILYFSPLPHLPSQRYFPGSPHMYWGGFMHLFSLDVLLPWAPCLSP